MGWLVPHELYLSVRPREREQYVSKFADNLISLEQSNPGVPGVL